MLEKKTAEGQKEVRVAAMKVSQKSPRIKFQNRKLDKKEPFENSCNKMVEKF